MIVKASALSRLTMDRGPRACGVCHAPQAEFNFGAMVSYHIPLPRQFNVKENTGLSTS